jgi:hypothetical protein
MKFVIYKTIISKKVELSLQQAVKDNRAVRRRGSHIFYTIEVRLSTLRAGHPLPLGRFLVLISVRG